MMESWLSSSSLSSPTFSPSRMTAIRLQVRSISSISEEMNTTDTKCNVFEKDKIDLLMEGYLIYGETLEQGAHRILRQTLPTAPLDHLHFNFMYHFENEATNRLVYLFTLDLDDDSILCNKNFKGGKLWTFQQMEHNLGRNFFSSCLEYEFEHLEAIIYTREKYKEF